LNLTARTFRLQKPELGRGVGIIGGLKNLKPPMRGGVKEPVKEADRMKRGRGVAVVFPIKNKKKSQTARKEHNDASLREERGGGTSHLSGKDKQQS